MTKSIEEQANEAHILNSYRYDSKNGNIYYKQNVGNKKSGEKAGSVCKNNGYSRMGIGNTVRLLHRVAWFLYYGKWPEKHLDHINGIKSDNRIENLREVTHRQNSFNLKRHREGELLGAHYDKHKYKKKWVAKMRINGKSKFLGSYKTKEEAHKRYVEYLNSIGDSLIDVDLTKADQMLKEMGIKL